MISPGEPDTNPTFADTNGNGVTDGADDANKNGMLDVGETDPAAGFYERPDNLLYGGAMELKEVAGSPYGDGFYGEFFFDRGSFSTGVTLTMDSQGGSIIDPSFIAASGSQVVPVSVFIPSSEAGAPARAIRANAAPVKLALPQDPDDFRFSNWVKNNFDAQPPASYRADCDDFCKMAIWRFLSSLDSSHSGLDTSQQWQTNPTGWHRNWGSFECYTHQRQQGWHWIVYPGAVNVRNCGRGSERPPGGASEFCWDWALKDITAQAITGHLGDEGRVINWGVMRPGDMVFVNYYKKQGDYDIYGTYSTGRRIDHVFVLVQQPQNGLPRMFGQGGFWTVKDGQALGFDDLNGGQPIYKPTGRLDAYLFESHWVPWNDEFAGFTVPLDFRQLNFRIGHTPRPPGNPPLRYDLMNSIDDHFMIESSGVVGTSNPNNLARFVKAIKRYIPPRP